MGNSQTSRVGCFKSRSAAGKIAPPCAPGAASDSAGERSVIVVGVCAASGCGKGALVAKLAEEFNTPYSFCADHWFKPRPPPCQLGGPYHPAGHRCYEAPGAVDFDMFLREVRRVVDELRIAKAGPAPEVCVETPLTGSDPVPYDMLGRQPRDLRPASAGPLYVFLEGFKLFADEEIVKYCDRLIWLEADLETCAQRRATRPGNRCPVRAYEQVVWPGHAQWKRRMLERAYAHPSRFVMRENFEDASLDALMRCTVNKLTSSAAAPGDPASCKDAVDFEIALNRPDCTRLGIDVDLQDGETLLIDSINAGPVSDWNASNSERQVRVGDRVIAVNAIQGDALQLRLECEESPVLRIKFRRDTRTSAATT